MIKVGYLGPDAATFGYEAAEKYFKDSLGLTEFVPFVSHRQVCEEVGRCKVDFGAVAIENSIDGPVVETIHAVEHAFRKDGIHILGEVVLPIKLFYLQKESKEPPLKLISHAVALRQCQDFVRSLTDKGIIVEISASTGEAAKKASENSEYGVLASLKAEQVYGLKRLKEESVADCSNNFTRFWILGAGFAESTGRDKTCILVNLDQAKPGVLCRALECFARHNVNLLIVFPNPIKGRVWEYTFVLEFSGHIFDEDMERAYEELNNSGLCPGGPLVLGSYPMAESIMNDRKEGNGDDESC